METKGLDDIYTDFQAQQVAQENPNSFWSKHFLAPFKKVARKIKKQKVYTFAEKRILVEKRNKKKISLKKRK